MEDNPQQQEMNEPANLRFLRRLVTALTGTMIVGLIILIALIVIRFWSTPAAGPALPQLPEAISLPEGASAQAITFGTGWIAVVTDDQQILVYDSASGALRDSLDLRD
ncbi:DUF6476 family protein [Pseudooceanicola nanhaiensis]|uniref:DUF6476 family protein n=1 Tax=Pseudooceanicola nanhaiensis TaxID=375761 RepID=UPI001CD6D0C8|nr:DUF6476 family protein [Pseudooceanicola nanhaiensis]MCA0919607.1 DUF6476 family protein [Pseudooceanicola nanhaiensis]